MSKTLKENLLQWMKASDGATAEGPPPFDAFGEALAAVIQMSAALRFKAITGTHAITEDECNTFNTGLRDTLGLARQKISEGYDFLWDVQMLHLIINRTDPLGDEYVKEGRARFIFATDNLFIIYGGLIKSGMIAPRFGLLDGA